MIDKLVEILFNAYEAFTVAVFLSTTDGLRCVSSITFSKHFQKQKLLSVEETLPGLVMRRGEVLIMPSFDRDEESLGYYAQREGIKAFLGCPLAEKGVLVIDSKKRWSFSEKEKRMLPSISSMLSDLLEGEKRLSEIEEALEDARKTREILRLFETDPSMQKILAQACELVCADLAFVAIERGGNLFIEEVSSERCSQLVGKKCPKGTITYDVFTKGVELILPFDSPYLRTRPVCFERDSLEPRQLFLFPLRCKETPFGILAFLSQRAPIRGEAIESLREISLFLSFYYRSVLTEEYTRTIGSLDALTGALQFQPFLSTVQELVRKRRRFTLVSLLLKDVREYNRVLGLEGTNEFLRKVSSIIRYHFGKNSLACRKSGGHFYILLKERADLPTALEGLKISLLRLIEKEGLSWEGAVEIGSSSFPDESEEVFELIEIAEKKT